MTFELADDQPEGACHHSVQNIGAGYLWHQMMSTGNRQPGVVAVERG